VAALGKLVDPQSFEDHLTLHSAMPLNVALAMAAVLPWLELVLGICFALGHAPRETALLAAVLLTLFLGYVLMAYQEGDCGCFLLPGWRPPGEPWWLAIRNVVLLACCGCLLFSPPPHSSSTRSA